MKARTAKLAFNVVRSQLMKEQAVQSREGIPLEKLRRLRPTTEQYQEFGAYLPEAHSWYKHLPLLEGARFVVFVAPDAGVGRLVVRLHGDNPQTATGYTLETPPEGSEFTDEHPRLHYGWKTTKEYRTRFGHLDYMRRYASSESYRDAGPPVPLPIEVEQQCSFVLFPYVSYTFAEATTWGIHDEDLEQLRAGATHPARKEVLELADLAEALGVAWGTLDEEESKWVIARDIEEELPLFDKPSENLQKYLAIDEDITSLSTLLRNREVEKIRRALAALDDCLQHN